MNPINYNDPYLKSNGDITTIGAVAGGGGDTPELPDYDISDAGKVLTVGDDGELEWHESGAGGGEVIVDDAETYASGSGSHTYTKSITIAESGNYCIFTGLFCTSVTVKINNVTQENYFNNGSTFTHFYRAVELPLNAGDVLDFEMVSSGQTAFINTVIKL